MGRQHQQWRRVPHDQRGGRRRTGWIHCLGNSPGEAQGLYDRVAATLGRVASPRTGQPASPSEKADLVIVAE